MKAAYIVMIGFLLIAGIILMTDTNVNTGSETGKGGTGGGSADSGSGSSDKDVIVDNSEVVNSLDAIKDALVSKGTENCGCGC